MVDSMGVKGASDRAVARVLASASVAPTQPATRAPQPQPDVASLSGVAAKLASRPPVDTERVQQIKNAVANGTFPILPATIADRLLALRYDWMSL